jgi:hypothetical protein
MQAAKDKELEMVNARHLAEETQRKALDAARDRERQLSDAADIAGKRAARLEAQLETATETAERAAAQERELKEELAQLAEAAQAAQEREKSLQEAAELARERAAAAETQLAKAFDECSIRVQELEEERTRVELSHMRALEEAQRDAQADERQLSDVVSVADEPAHGVARKAMSIEHKKAWKKLARGPSKAKAEAPPRRPKEPGDKASRGDLVRAGTRCRAPEANASSPPGTGALPRQRRWPVLCCLVLLCVVNAPLIAHFASHLEEAQHPQVALPLCLS